MRTVCLEPGCPVKVERGGRCPTHGKAHDGRPSSSRRGYGRAWSRTRAAFLEQNRLCARCGATATVADHHPTSRARLVELGVEDVDAWHRLQPLCAPCHGRKTVEYDGAFGRPKR
jgi:5-methylcytosine-specific restriction enzyme A